ncbi:fucolectin-6-like [Physella acuta]|uniref:fucolectin-6-like n=1 Tax=Physella acuta TaxID=109671 RepID=UPI0027DDCB0D|nr:fucolectin-6-like [Physella acuta]
MHYCIPTLGDDVLYNVALYKPAFQSSVYFEWYAEKGNDGKKKAVTTSDACCTHTLYENNSWWMVDLLDTYVISSVVLTNLNDNNVTAARLKNFQIDVFNKDPRLAPTFPSDSGDICYRQTTAATIGTFTWNCSKPLVGRYVRLIKYTKDYLNFCELEVMASPKTTQSSDFKIYDNRKLNMTSSLDVTDSSSVSCGSQCLERRYTDGCAAFNWFPSTRLCQLLNVDPRDTKMESHLVLTPEAQFYVLKF